MRDVVISAEGLGKRYIIGHESADRERYTALRDVIGRSLKGLGRSALDLLRGRQIIAGDEIEEFWALKDVSFEIARGEVTGIIGRNGAGKSTLLKILSRITEPSKGRVEIKGRVASLLEVGTGFHPELSGRENIYLNGAILGMTRAEIKHKFEEIVDFAGVEKFLDTPVKRYSSGMYVRLAFAVAAHLEPEILVVDEVLAVGDAEFQRKCLTKMGEAGRGGRTVLFVSHNMNAIERLCSRVLCVDQGSISSDHSDVRAGISNYLRNVGGDAGSSQWTAIIDGTKKNGNEYFRATAFSIESNATNSGSSNVLSNKYPIKVTVEGEIIHFDPAVNIGIAVYNESEQLLFWSFTTDQEESEWPKINAGRVSLQVFIESRILNEGRYSIELLASLHRRSWILEPRTNVPKLHFAIRGGLSESPFWDSKRPGELAPILPWKLCTAASMPTKGVANV